MGNENEVNIHNGILLICSRKGSHKIYSKWIKLENNIPDEVTWAPKSKPHMSSLI